MTHAIKTLKDGYRGLSLLMDLGRDRVLFPLAIGLALSLGAHLMTL